jgi:hypothetical protein
MFKRQRANATTPADKAALAASPFAFDYTARDALIAQGLNIRSVTQEADGSRSILWLRQPTNAQRDIAESVLGDVHHAT